MSYSCNFNKTMLLLNFRCAVHFHSHRTDYQILDNAVHKPKIAFLVAKRQVLKNSHGMILLH